MHRRRLHSDEQELAYALVARGAGTTANARAASEVERAGQSVPSLDLSEAQWWTDREAIKGELKKEGKDTSFTNTMTWLYDHPFDPAKHRLAMTAIPMTPLLLLKDSLTSLNIAHHSVLELPESFFQLKLLEVLNLTGNCLLILSPFVARLERLRVLKISYNFLEALPAELSELSSTLEELELDEKDAITSPPKEVWTQGLGATMDFLRAGAETGFAENLQLKVLVLGRSEVGKTSMIHGLVDGSARLTRVGDRTVGIDAHTLSVPLEEEEEKHGTTTEEGTVAGGDVVSVDLDRRVVLKGVGQEGPHTYFAPLALEAIPRVLNDLLQGNYGRLEDLCRLLSMLGSAAAEAAGGKHRRYPAWALPGGRLVAFSVETFGRWGTEALDWLRGAVDAVAEVDPQVAAAGHWGKVALLNAWHTRLSVALQKANAACLLQAGKVRRNAEAYARQVGCREISSETLYDAKAHYKA